MLKDKLTIVGSMNTSRRDIPDNMKPSKTLLANDLTMVSYVSKKNKSVVLLSSMHHDKAVSNEDHSKPKITLFYN